MSDEPTNGSGTAVTIKEMLLDLNTKVDQFISEVQGLRAKQEQVRRIQEDHEQRLRKVEIWKYAIPATLFVSLLGFLQYVLQAGGVS